MRFTLLAAFASLASALPKHDIFFTRGNGGGLQVQPGPVSQMIVDENTTLNGTHKGPTVVVPPSKGKAAQINLPLTFVNNFNGPVNAYMVGKCPNGAVCFVRGDGSIVYPSSGGSGVPQPVDSNSVRIVVNQGETLNLRAPVALNSARIYFAAGDLQFGMVATPNGDGLVQPAPNNPHDPSAGVNFGFVEFNLDPNGTIYSNISYVDFVGLVLGMQLEDNNGPTQTARGLRAGSVDGVCNDLRAQGQRDGRPWGGHCVTNGSGNVVRVLSPNSYADVDPNGFADYWNDYVNQVYSRYSGSDLTMRTQFGDHQCRANGNTMTCNGDERAYDKPSARDIWGCNGGPFANTGSDLHKAHLAILCAAFHRTTLLLDGGNIQPSLPASSYYTTSPSNFYSKSVHAHELDGKGYAFPYDDVNVAGENQSGTLASSNPRSLLIWIGGN